MNACFKGSSHPEQVFSDRVCQKAAADESKTLKEIQKAHAAVSRQVTHDLSGLSVDCEVIVLAGVGNVKHIDREQDVFGVQLSMEAAAGRSHGPVARPRLSGHGGDCAGLHPVLCPRGDVFLFLVETVRGEAGEIAHVKRLCLPGVKGLEGVHQAVLNSGAGIHREVLKIHCGFAHQMVVVGLCDDIVPAAGR